MNDTVRAVSREVRTTARALWADGTGWTLLAVSAGWALSIGIRFVYPALLPVLQAEFDIGLTTGGFLLTVLWGAYALGHIPGGILGDRLGEGNVLVLSAVVSTLTMLVVATAVSATWLFVGTVLFGLATALYGPTRFTILTDLYGARSGSAIGVTMATGNIGNAAFPALATFIAGVVGWRFGFGVFVPLLGVVAAALLLVVPSRTSGTENAADELSLQTLRRLRDGISLGAIPIVVIVQVSLSFLIQGFTSFYPTYLVEVKRLAPETAAAVFGGFFLLGAGIQPISGTAMDRVGVRQTLLLCLTACVLGLVALPFVDGVVALIGVTALVAAWNGTIVVTQTYIADTLPSEMQGTGFGMLKASWMLIGATAPALIGVLANNGFFDEAFLLLGVVGGASVLLVALRL